MTASTEMPPIEQELQQELQQARTELAEQTAALRVAEQRTEAALMVALLVGQLAETDGLAIIVTDVVDCWRHLRPEVRGTYTGRLHETALQAFTGDYTIAVDHIWRTSDRDDTVHTGILEPMARLSWQIRIAQIRQRQIMNEPLDPTWLQQFPIPHDTN